MKKRIRRLRLERETLRSLTPNHLHAAAGASTTIIDPFETYWNSCNPADLESRPASACASDNMTC